MDKKKKELETDVIIEYSDEDIEIILDEEGSLDGDAEDVERAANGEI